MRSFLIICILLTGIGGSAQYNAILEIQAINPVDSLTQEIDFSKNLIQPRKFNISANPKTEILEIAQVKGFSLGIEFEFFVSRLQGTKHLVYGYVIYKRKIGVKKWDMLAPGDFIPVMDQSGKLGFKGRGISSIGLLLEEVIDLDLMFEIIIN
jgi:hypothetical protein